MIDSFVSFPMSTCQVRLNAEIFKRDGRTVFTAKAYNGRVLTEWLARCLTHASEHPNLYPDPEHQVDLLASCAHLGLN